MAMRLAALTSLCILMASAETSGSLECTNAAWMLSYKPQSGEDLCLDAASKKAVDFYPCHGGPNQQWYQKDNMIHNLKHSVCLTRAIASSQFLLTHCDRAKFLQHFTVTSKNGSLFIWQDSFCLTLGWEGQRALPLAGSCSMHSDRQTLTKTALTCMDMQLWPWTSRIPGTLDAPLQPPIEPPPIEPPPIEPIEEDSRYYGYYGLYAVLVVLRIVLINLGIILVSGVLCGRAVRMHLLSAIPTQIRETMEELLAELKQEMKECRPEVTQGMKLSERHQSDPKTSMDMELILGHLAALKSSVNQLGNLPELIVSMETKISSRVCEMDSRTSSISAVTTSFGRSIQCVAERLTELTKEMKESREDQLKLEMKIDQGLVDHITACKSQVGQLKQLVSRGYMETYETSDTSSSAGSLDSWIRIPGGEPCCYLPETYFQVRTADGDEILSPATKLIEGSQVKADDGTWVQVTSPPEQHHRPVIKLQADQSFLVVSEDHRIVVRGNQTVLAKDLSKDEQVMLDGKTKARLTFVERLKPTMVLKIAFRPDLAVRAFMVTPAILSKGSRKRNFRRGNHQGEEGLVGSDPESEMPNTYRSY